MIIRVKLLLTVIILIVVAAISVFLKDSNGKIPPAVMAIPVICFLVVWGTKTIKPKQSFAVSFWKFWYRVKKDPQNATYWLMAILLLSILIVLLIKKYVV